MNFDCEKLSSSKKHSGSFYRHNSSGPSRSRQERESWLVDRQQKLTKFFCNHHHEDDDEHFEEYKDDTEEGDDDGEDDDHLNFLEPSSKSPAYVVRPFKRADIEGRVAEQKAGEKLQEALFSHSRLATVRLDAQLSAFSRGATASQARPS
jgi:hypothetical protein